MTAGGRELAGWCGAAILAAALLGGTVAAAVRPLGDTGPGPVRAVALDLSVGVVAVAAVPAGAEAVAEDPSEVPEVPVAPVPEAGPVPEAVPETVPEPPSQAVPEPVLPPVQPVRPVLPERERRPDPPPLVEAQPPAAPVPGTRPQRRPEAKQRQEA
ncbi:MAG: hypothetical protein Q27BPR15_10970, partial [Rhodobacter sp. CACIA14H1]